MSDCDRLDFCNGLPHPHSDLPHPQRPPGCLNEDEVEPRPDHPQRVECRGTTSQLMREVASARSPSPKMSAGAAPSFRTSSGSVPSPGASGGEGSSRSSEAKSEEEGTMARKMTKREKKFVLSKDKGQYSELNPISPHEARQEFGDSLHLKQVEPPVGGVSEEPAAVSNSSSAVPQPNPGGEGREVAVRSEGRGSCEE